MHDELDGRRARKRDTIFSAGQSIGHLQRMEAFHPRRPPSSIPSCRTLVLVGRGTQAPNGADSLGTPAFLARSQRWFGNQIPCPSQLLSPLLQARMTAAIRRLRGVVCVVSSSCSFRPLCMQGKGAYASGHRTPPPADASAGKRVRSPLPQEASTVKRN